ncbi:MAG TPA: S41 family peptidase [Ignavibacteriaceae bacterium]|nr:S41 family peptidase [Ignavibacteriaceae bacterium]
MKLFLTGSLLILFLTGFYAGKGDIYFEISKNLELFGRVYKEISIHYVDDVDPEQFMRAGIRGMLSSLDPYTIFIDEKKKEDIDLITNGKYGGIGISIGVRGDDVTVVEIMDGYSAQRQGVQIGDIIIEAGGVLINSENVDEISSLVKGEPGTTIGLRIVRNELRDTISFDLVREEVIVKNLTFAGFYPENSNNVVLKLSNFSRSASDELKNTLRDLKAQKEIHSVILDLRNNPGGLLDIAVDICNKFIKKDQLIVTTKGRDDSDLKSYFSMEEPLMGNANLIVLINGGSASASEIVAGAIQDHDRGIILGTKSFGKGLVQTITPLSFNTSLKITTAKYYTPSGRSIQKVDYSEDSDVIRTDNLESEKSYLTDNKREVFSRGGITPDTTIDYSVNGDLTRDLLAKGYFFKFANYYYYKFPTREFSQIDDKKLLSEFNDYLTNENYIYQSQVEKEIVKLISEVSEKDQNLADELKAIEGELEKLYKSEYRLFEDEITGEIKAELASRYIGMEGRIVEQFTRDTQVQTAINILQDKKVYNRLLNVR